MRKYIVVLLLLVCFMASASAQYAFFPNSGTVTYERKFHLQNYLKRNFLNKPDLGTWDKISIEQAVKSGPVEMVTHHSLKFFDEETLFETIQEEYPANYRNVSWYSPFISDSKTYINVKDNSFLKLLPFGDEELLMKDSLPTVKWKYTDEYRNIAGYDCRRANGIIQDSIYVVAFFANQIPVPAGPELIHGLPGMILGVSIPSMNINMFATKVELNNIPVSKVLTKKKKVVAEPKAAVIAKLKTSVYDWLGEKEFNKKLNAVLF
ncbi:GLPGLI family protein [Sphingobacterium faecium]|uniref:GLPGLI family protein n=1 Tax=Sphingobacterium faecium TaxID=34087 RepID=UPI000F9F3F4B|nr:GLPGLI family protein [Sphingobacterium faecium]MQP25991.1 GLPGLI family protein [Sphingobacterium faecium]